MILKMEKNQRQRQIQEKRTRYLTLVGQNRRFISTYSARRPSKKLAQTPIVGKIKEMNMHKIDLQLSFVPMEDVRRFNSFFE